MFISFLCQLPSSVLTCFLDVGLLPAPLWIPLLALTVSSGVDLCLPCDSQSKSLDSASCHLYIPILVFFLFCLQSFIIRTSMFLIYTNGPYCALFTAVIIITQQSFPTNYVIYYVVWFLLIACFEEHMQLPPSERTLKQSANVV